MGSAACVAQPEELPVQKRQNVFDDKTPSLNGLAQLFRDGRVKNVIIAAGGGTSCSAGISDYRTPGTGLYDQLKELGLPAPECVFHLEYFKENPEPFTRLEKDIMPGNYRPTPTHCFFRLLELKGILKRVYTQNVDGLERLAGVTPDLLVEAHGSMADCHCIECKQQFSVAEWHRKIQLGEIPRCPAILPIYPPPEPKPSDDVHKLKAELATVSAAKKKAIATIDLKQLTDLGIQELTIQKKIDEILKYQEEYPVIFAAWDEAPKEVPCNALVKPDIILYGERLPPRFTYMANRDGKCADLLIIMGTSLQVMPFAGILGKVGPLCPRLLINNEAVGFHDQEDPPMCFGNIGLRANLEDNYRDVHFAGACDDGVHELCKLIGWEEELAALEEAARKLPVGAGSTGFHDLFASKQEPDKLFADGYDKLSAQVYEAMLHQAQELSVGDFEVAESKLAASNEEPLLVSFADVLPQEMKSKDTVTKEQFMESMPTPFRALGARAFTDIVNRQLLVLTPLPVAVPVSGRKASPKARTRQSGVRRGASPR